MENEEERWTTKGNGVYTSDEEESDSGDSTTNVATKKEAKPSTVTHGRGSSANFDAETLQDDTPDEYFTRPVNNRLRGNSRRHSNGWEANGRTAVNYALSDYEWDWQQSFNDTPPATDWDSNENDNRWEPQEPPVYQNNYCNQPSAQNTRMRQNNRSFNVRGGFTPQATARPATNWDSNESDNRWEWEPQEPPVYQNNYSNQSSAQNTRMRQNNRSFNVRGAYTSRATARGVTTAYQPRNGFNRGNQPAQGIYIPAGTSQHSGTHGDSSQYSGYHGETPRYNGFNGETSEFNGYNGETSEFYGYHGTTGQYNSSHGHASHHSGYHDNSSNGYEKQKDSNSRPIQGRNFRGYQNDRGRPASNGRRFQEPRTLDIVVENGVHRMNLNGL
jgi:hypothetical protein